MDLSRESAMRLWSNAFGKEMKVTDFAGRVMVKNAYHNGASEFGWDIVPVFPQDGNGSETESSVICCHIKTSEEKAENYPVFRANEKDFEIVKVKNHHEIREIAETCVPDFSDPECGLTLFRNSQETQSKPRFVGTLFIRLYGLHDTTLIEFIREFTKIGHVAFKQGDDLRIVSHHYDMPLKENSSELLETCVLLNTYLSKYFMPLGYIEGFDIFYRMDYFEDTYTMYRYFEHLDAEFAGGQYYYQNSLFLNRLVLKNTRAGEKTVCPPHAEYVEYNVEHPTLAESLTQKVNEIRGR